MALTVKLQLLINTLEVLSRHKHSLQSEFKIDSKKLMYQEEVKIRYPNKSSLTFGSLKVKKYNHVVMIKKFFGTYAFIFVYSVTSRYSFNDVE